MAEESKNKTSDQIVPLKELVGVNDLSKEETAYILITIREWIYDFYNQAAGNKKVSANFKIRNFSGNEFDLSTDIDIISASVDLNKEPFLFISDLVNFVEQIYHPIPTAFSFDDKKKTNISSQLGSIWQLLGVSPSSDNKISIDDLEKIQAPSRRRQIVEHINKILVILELEKVEEIKADEKDRQDITGESQVAPSASETPAEKAPSTKNETEGGNEPSQQQFQEQERIKITELDPQVRFYIQALSIIAINQALSKYFNAESLAKFGLPPDLEITFDQLPLNVRNQLMDRSFLQVERLLLSGNFSLEDLIKNQSQRIIFSSEAALNLLMDVHALRLLNDAVRDIAQRGAKAKKKAEDNAKDQLIDSNLSQRIKNTTAINNIEIKNILNSQQAQELIEKSRSIQNFAQTIERQLNIVSSEKELEEIFSRKIAEIIGNNDGIKIKLIVDNVRPLIEVFVQQGLPPEYLIPDPKNFDYNRFVNIFGRSLSQNEFNNHKEELANLIIFYWKRKRAIWAKEIREEFGQERYTPEEAGKLYETIKKDPKKSAELRNLGTLNLVYGGRQIAEELANNTDVAVGSADKNGLAAELAKATEASAAARAMLIAQGIIPGEQGASISGQNAPTTNKDTTLNAREAANFAKLQKEMVDNFLQQEIAKLSKKDQQQKVRIYNTFYIPQIQTTQTEYTVETFQKQVVPQINSMDLYALQAAEVFGPGSFTKDGSGYVQQAFAPGADYHGTALMDGAVGQKSDKNQLKKQLAVKAISQGLYTALDAAGGWGEALRAAEKVAPVVKQVKEKLIELGLDKVIDFGKKYWPIIVPGLILMAITPVALLLIPAYFVVKNVLVGTSGVFSGAKNLFSGKSQIGAGVGQGVGNNLGSSQATGQAAAYSQATAQAATATKTAAAKTLTTVISSNAMVTAGQAVIATVGITTAFFYIYQDSLNSAFLTDFPATESSIAGENSVEKTSKYAEIDKTAVITDGCSNPENNGVKCENPSFPVSITYTITIKPKEDFALQITDIKDTIKFKQSKKGWEEIGQPPPSIQYEKILDFDYFKNIIKEQGNLSNEPLISTPISEPEIQPIENLVTPTETEEIIIPAGGSLTFTYTMDNLSADYNNTAILNIIEVNFYYQNSAISGTDNVITAARVCLGNCSAGAGCWPTTGILSQMPFGTYSHSPAPGNTTTGYADAYDIANAALPMVFAPFAGNLCFVNCTDSGFGCHYTLSFQDGGESQKLLFAHFEQPNSQLSQEGTCMNVDEGFFINIMGNRGNSSGPHLHYEAAFNGQFYSPTPRNFSILETLVPETNQGSYPPVLNDTVSTCYE